MARQQGGQPHFILLTQGIGSLNDLCLFKVIFFISKIHRIPEKLTGPFTDIRVANCAALLSTRDWPIISSELWHALQWASEKMPRPHVNTLHCNFVAQESSECTTPSQHVLHCKDEFRLTVKNELMCLFVCPYALVSWVKCFPGVNIGMGVSYVGPGSTDVIYWHGDPMTWGI